MAYQQEKFWLRFRRNRKGFLGFVITSLIVLIVILVPLFVQQGPWDIGTIAFRPPGTPNHLFGTDDLDRDIFSQVLYGGRTSLIVGFLASATATIIGVLVGSLSGYFGGLIDDIALKITEVFQSVPLFFFVLLFVVMLGPSIWLVITAIGILSWPSTARLARAEFLTLKEREFVEAARMLGAGNARIIFREILPNAWHPVIVNATLQVARAILIEAGLSFLGLGDPTIMSWGYMLYNARRFFTIAGWLPIFPGLFLFLTIFAINMLGDGLNDALNPRSEQRWGY